MKRTELSNMTRRELYEMAKAYDVPGRSRMAKDDLVDSLCRVSAKGKPPAPKAQKRRMAKRRKRRRPSKPTSTSVSQAPPPSEERAQAPEIYIDRGPELNSHYNQDKLQAMVRDPNWLYAYWDLSGPTSNRIFREVQGGTWVLRVFDVTQDASDDVPVLLEGGNWYVPVAADTEYRLEIGVIDRDGVFHAAASSRKLRTPRMGISELVDEEWMILEDEFRRLMSFSGSMSDQLSGSRMISEVISGQHRITGIHSAGVSSFSGSRRE